MFDERIETSNHITDDMRESDSGMALSDFDLEAMGVPKNERDAFFKEHRENEEWKAGEHERIRDEFAMASKEV